MAGCSGGCNKSNYNSVCSSSKDKCNKKCIDKNNNSKDECCSGGNSKCDCGSKLKVAQKLAVKRNGCDCLLCNTFCMYAEPNRCNGDFICHKCKTDYAWKIPKGKWIK